MKNSKNTERFRQWSSEWKAERSNSDVQRLLRLWRQPMPTGWEREVWNGKLGYRKLSNSRGEQLIESQLLSDKFEYFELTFSGSETSPKYRIRVIYHNMPLANQRSGQVIADAFGILETNKSARPLFIEVKTTADDPWFALIENLQQIRLARACARKIKSFAQLNSKLRVEPGVWGLILAPESYYKKHSISLARCCSLLINLKQSTRARVAFGTSESLVDGQIRLVAHNWFSQG
jgi:hypothetical protein